jgi:hypothetical protein
MRPTRRLRIERGNTVTWLVVDSSEASSDEKGRPEEGDVEHEVVGLRVPRQGVAGSGIQRSEVATRSAAERGEASADIDD